MTPLEEIVRSIDEMRARRKDYSDPAMNSHVVGFVGSVVDSNWPAIRTTLTASRSGATVGYERRTSDGRRDILRRTAETLCLDNDDAADVIEVLADLRDADAALTAATSQAAQGDAGELVKAAQTIWSAARVNLNPMEGGPYDRGSVTWDGSYRVTRKQMDALGAALRSLSAQPEAKQ